MTTVNVITFDVDALMYVVLITAEKHVPHEELVGTRECIMSQLRCHTKRGCNNRIQLYFRFHNGLVATVLQFLLKKMECMCLYC